jgi:hypothetical protein
MAVFKKRRGQLAKFHIVIVQIITYPGLNCSNPYSQNTISAKTQFQPKRDFSRSLNLKCSSHISTLFVSKVSRIVFSLTK